MSTGESPTITTRAEGPKTRINAPRWLTRLFVAGTVGSAALTGCSASGEVPQPADTAVVADQNPGGAQALPEQEDQQTFSPENITSLETSRAILAELDPKITEEQKQYAINAYVNPDGVGHTAIANVANQKEPGKVFTDVPAAIAKGLNSPDPLTVKEIVNGDLNLTPSRIKNLLEECRAKLDELASQGKFDPNIDTTDSYMDESSTGVTSAMLVAMIAGLENVLRLQQEGMELPTENTWDDINNDDSFDGYTMMVNDTPLVRPVTIQILDGKIVVGDKLPANLSRYAMGAETGPYALHVWTEGSEEAAASKRVLFGNGSFSELE